MKNDTKQPEKPGKKRDRTAYMVEYKRRRYDRIVVEYPTGYRDTLKAAAAARGLSLQGLFRAAVAAYIGEPEPGTDPEKSGDASSQNI